MEGDQCLHLPAPCWFTFLLIILFCTASSTPNRRTPYPRTAVAVGRRTSLSHATCFLVSGIDRPLPRPRQAGAIPSVRGILVENDRMIGKLSNSWYIPKWWGKEERRDTASARGLPLDSDGGVCHLPWGRPMDRNVVTKRKPRRVFHLSFWNSSPPKIYYEII